MNQQINQKEVAREIVRTVELLTFEESEDDYELDIYDSEYNVLIRCDLTGDKTAIIIESKTNSMRVECISGKIELAKGISETDALYWQRKAESLKEDTIDEHF